MKEGLLFDISKAFTCSHMITPDVMVLPFNFICVGMFLSVLEIGHTIAARVKELYT